MLKSSWSKKLIEAGCDEAGRGCLAGPVFAAAVIFPRGYANARINDSKKLSQKQRNELREEIESQAISFAVSSVDVETIDKINILNASILAMHQAIEALTVCPDLLLIDGNRFQPLKHFDYQTIVGGDGKFMSIAAAGILAKTYRDEYMCVLDEKFPSYQWRMNKGYGTLSHRKAISQYGHSIYHRRSFKLKNKIGC